MKQDKIRPIHSNIIVKPDDADEKTSSGILWIPNAAQEKPLRGTVVAISKGKLKEDGSRETMDLKVGQKVFFTKNYTTEIQHNGSEHLLMNQNRVLLIDDRK